MHWGIPTLIELPGPEESAALCRELGFQFVELNMNLPEYQQWDIARLQEASEKYGIYYTAHVDENLDVCNFNQRVADAYLETLLEAISAAKRLNVPTLNMHLQKGVYFTLPNEKIYLYRRYWEQYSARLAKAVVGCEQAAAGSDLKICIENTGVYHLDFLQSSLDAFLQSPLFGLTYDIGHDYSAGQVDKPVILERQDRLQHFHIHDALGGKNHLELGSGEMDIPWYIHLAEERHCRAVLEVKTAAALRASAKWLKDRQLIE